MHNILLISNGSKVNSKFKEEAKHFDVDIHTYWDAPDNVEYIATINRQYIHKNIELQHGKQINRIVDGIFWKDKIVQLTSLNTVCRKPKYLIGQGIGFQHITNILGLPFIAKRSTGTRGENVFMIRNYNEYIEAIDCDIFEEVIWNSIGRDIRVYSVNGEVRCCMLRQNINNFKSNYHQGGKGSNYSIDSDIIEIAKTIYKTTRLNIMGIDLLLDKDGYVFCELNTNPGFEELDRACDYNAAREILELCIK